MEAKVVPKEEVPVEGEVAKPQVEVKKEEAEVPKEEDLPVLPPYLEKDFTAGKSTGTFFMPPWHDGPEDGIEWPRLPRTNGQRPSPCGTESGMRADDLSVPSSIAFSNHAELHLQSDEEYQNLIESNFDDIAHTNPGGVEYAKSWFDRRVALETGYFSGKACSLHIRQRYQEDGTGGEDRFQVRAVSRTYAVATRVVNTFEVSEIYSRIAAEAEQHEFRTMSSQIVARIERATTLLECEGINDMLTKLLEKYLSERKVKEEQATRDWLATCRSKSDDIAKATSAVLAEKEKEGEVTEEDGEEDEDALGLDADQKRAEKEKKEAEEQAKAKRMRPVHMLSATLFLLDKADKNIGHLICRKEGFLVPEPNPDFAPEKEYVEVAPPAAAAAGTAVVMKPLDEILKEQREKTAHAMKQPFAAEKLAACNGDKGAEERVIEELAADYTAALVAKEAEDEKQKKKGKRGKKKVLGSAVAIREITRFERITSERIRSSLHFINLTPGCSSGKWRDLKVPVLIPCAVDAYEQSVLIVDHDRARVLLMPSGTETGEEYNLLDASGTVGFKVVACSLNAHWILILGYRAGQNVTTLVAICRSSDPSVKTKRVSVVFSSSIPMVSAILSERTTKKGDASMLVGFVDGTLLRCPILPTMTTHSAAFVAIASSKKQCEEMRAKEESFSVFAEYDGKKKKGKPKKRLHIPVYWPEFDPDETLWCGYTAPITRIVEHGKRIVASSPMGLHIFKLNIPYTLEQPDPRAAAEEEEDGKRKTIVTRSERVAHLPLEHNASFDFRGNILAVHKTNNSFELVNLHTYKLEACIGAPTSMQPVPPDIFVECSSISLDDSRILFMHSDGSYRSLDINDYNLFTAPLSKSKLAPKEMRDASFLSDTAAAEKKKGKKPSSSVGKRKKNNKGKKGK